MNPIQIPDDWADVGLVTFEEFCELTCTPQRTVRDLRRRGVGPRGARFNGCGRLYITVGEARDFSLSADVETPSRAPEEDADPCDLPLGGIW